MALEGARIFKYIYKLPNGAQRCTYFQVDTIFPNSLANTHKASCVFQSTRFAPKDADRAALASPCSPGQRCRALHAKRFVQNKKKQLKLLP